MKEYYMFSAPGRTEISGNHTDHQHGCVLAGAVNLETVADVTLNGTDMIRVASEGYAPWRSICGICPSTRQKRIPPPL